MLGKFWRICALMSALALIVKPGLTTSIEERPNFLLVVFEDMSPHIGAQQMRAQQGVRLPDSSRLPYTAVPPAHVKAYPELLRAAGYCTSNNGKTGYQLDLNISGGPFRTANRRW